MSMIIGYDFKSPSDVFHVLPLTYTLDQTNKTVPNMTDISISNLHTSSSWYISNSTNEEKLFNNQFFSCLEVDSIISRAFKSSVV